MSSYLILGPSGSGKSTLRQEIRARGYQVVDMDKVPGLIDWIDNATGELASQPDKSRINKSWRQSHERDWDAAKVENLLSSSSDEIVFYFGGSHNVRDYLTYFTACFGLHIKNKDLKQRLLVRNPKRWGDHSDELAALLDWNAHFPKFCRDYGIVAIDSSKRPSLLADTILSQLA